MDDEIEMHHLKCMSCQGVIGWTDVPCDDVLWLPIVVLCPHCMNHPEEVAARMGM